MYIHIFFTYTVKVSCFSLFIPRITDWAHELQKYKPYLHILSSTFTRTQVLSKCNIGLFLLFPSPSQPLEDCLSCLHISPMEWISRSCQCSEGTVRYFRWHEYGGSCSLPPGSDSGCLWRYRLEWTIPWMEMKSLCT